MNKYKKQLKKHNKYKINRELKALNKIEKDIKKNMNELNKEIKKIIYNTNSKANKWNKEELQKYNRLEKMNEEIEDKIKEKKKKEYNMVMGFLVTSTILTNSEIHDVMDSKAKKMTKAQAKDLVNSNWSGLTLLERHRKNTQNFIIKIKETTNSSIIKDEANIRETLKRINKEIIENGKSSFVLVDTENTHMNYELVKEAIKNKKNVELIYNAILDEATCEDCSADDGKIFKKGEEPDLPRHPNCRCAYTPVKRIN